MPGMHLEVQPPGRRRDETTFGLFVMCSYARMSRQKDTVWELRGGHLEFIDCSQESHLHKRLVHIYC